MHPPLISIVDDDEAVRRALGSLVRSMGYRAVVFSSAESFLASDEALSCQCIITDVQMPGLTGLALKQRLDARACRTPVIMITARKESAIEDDARKSGAVCLLRKPFDSSTLMSCLRTALEA